MADNSVGDWFVGVCDMQKVGRWMTDIPNNKEPRIDEIRNIIQNASFYSKTLYADNGCTLCLPSLAERYPGTWRVDLQTIVVDGEKQKGWKSERFSIFKGMYGHIILLKAWHGIPWDRSGSLPMRGQACHCRANLQIPSDTVNSPIEEIFFLTR